MPAINTSMVTPYPTNMTDLVPNIAGVNMTEILPNMNTGALLAGYICHERWSHCRTVNRNSHWIAGPGWYPSIFNFDDTDWSALTLHELDDLHAVGNSLDGNFVKFDSKHFMRIPGTITFDEDEPVPGIRTGEATMTFKDDYFATESKGSFGEFAMLMNQTVAGIYADAFLDLYKQAHDRAGPQMEGYLKSINHWNVRQTESRPWSFKKGFKSMLKTFGFFQDEDQMKKEYYPVTDGPLDNNDHPPASWKPHGYIKPGVHDEMYRVNVPS